MNLLFWFFYLMMFATGSIKVGEVFYVNHLILVMLLIWAGLSQWLRGRFGFPENFLLCFLCFLTSISISFFSNADLQAFRFISQLLIFFLSVFLTYLSVTSEEKPQRWLHVITLGCALNAVVGFYQSINWILENGFVLLANGKFFRVDGLCLSSTDYVLQLLVGLILSSTIRKTPLRQTVQWIYIVLLILSMSRSALVSLAILGLIKFGSGLQSKRRIIQYGLMGSMLVLIIFYLPYAAPVAERIIDISTMDYNIKRLLIYQDIIGKIFLGIPEFLFGSGFGTYSFYNPIDFQVYDNPHNLYLYLLYSAGFIGLVAFLLGAASLVSACNRLWRSFLPGHEMRKILGSILVLHLCVWLIGLVEVNIAGVGSGWLVGGIFGVPLAVRRKMPPML